MDKYEFNIKVEQIKKLVHKGDYETAMKIADSIDWRRVRSTSLLTMVAQVYERNEEYQDAKDILLLAFERAPIGKGLLFKLTDLAIREGNVPEAEAYYREFCDLSSDDPRQNLLRYLILEAKGAPLEQLVNSLERYCQEELDEKWLYRLAELYQESGREEDCVSICDKIMLMFGLGKYVDKAMELKLQYAPLTKYQMDLVENREKYEEKLRAVEQKYDKRKLHTDEEDFDAPDDEGIEGQDILEHDLVMKMREAEAEENLAREMSKLEPYDEEPDDSAGGETRVIGNIRDIKQLRRAEQAEEYKKASYQLEEEQLEDQSEEKDSELYPSQTVDRIKRQEYRTEYRASKPNKAGYDGTDEDKIAAVREMAATEDDEPVVEDWDQELEEELNNHLMIEAEDDASGLQLALESLKKIHKELGSKNPVAKISGDKLSKKRIFSVADRLAGKDLVVEHAADLDQITIQELCQLMDQDQSGMIVVLIDKPARMERLHSSNPVLAEKFQYIGCDVSAANKAVKTPVEERESLRERESRREEEFSEVHDAVSARRRLAEREEEIRRQAVRDAEETRKRLAEQEKYGQSSQRERQLETSTYQMGYSTEQEEYQPDYENENYREKERYVTEEQEYDSRYDIRKERLQAEYEAENAARIQAERAADEAKILAEYESRDIRDSRGEEEELRFQRQYEEEGQEPEYQEQSQGIHGMDVEEFAQYACKYASEIDCSISGKSMLALYERAEIMEEDGIPLTKESAEELIEEAADKAEKRSFGGMFSSKYDKDGLLILKEKHFFD